MRFYLVFLIIFVIFPALADMDVENLLEDGNSRGTKMVMFQQAASFRADATSISKITLAYFTTANCTGSKAGSGFYTTPDGTSFTISVGTPFGLVAAAAWNVGSTQLSIADMTTIQSIAVYFKSTNSATPQAAFTNASAQVISPACISVTCSSGECTSGLSTQSFTLKTAAAVGDPAEGGVIACQNTGSAPNTYDLVITTSDQHNGQDFGTSGTYTAATSITDGAANTATIVNCLTNLTGCSTNTPASSVSISTYGAGTCSSFSATGGHTSGWFLPSAVTSNSTTQANCLIGNRTAIATGSVAAGGAGFANNSFYWTSNDNSAGGSVKGNVIYTGTWTQTSRSKTEDNKVRCVRTF